MREIIHMLPLTFRRRGLRVAASLLLRAALNLAGLAALLPVLALLLVPDGISTGPLARWYDLSGLASERTFALAVCGAVVAVVILKNALNLRLARVERNYIYDLYRHLSRQLYVEYHDRGLPFIRATNSAILTRNVNVICLAFTAGVLRPAAAFAAEAMLLGLLVGALALYAPLAALLALAVFVPAAWLYQRLVRARIDRYGALENRAQRKKARIVAETFRGYADIEVNDAFPAMLQAFDRAVDEVVATRSSEVSIALLPQMLTETGLAVGLALLAAWGFGAEGVHAQWLFGIFAIAALRLMPSIRKMLASWASIRFNRYTVDILRETLRARESTTSGTVRASGRPTAGEKTAKRERSAKKGKAATKVDARRASGTTCATDSARNSGASGKADMICMSDQTCEIETSRKGGVEKLPFEQEIVFRNISFRYADAERNILDGFSLTIRKAERIGFRGPSGKGKTTLVHLLLGLYEPTAGHIEIDGQVLTARNRRAWQNRIGYVSQRLFLTDGSIAANVALGLSPEEIDRSRVMQALEAARLGEFAASLPQGADTPIGECGCRLSGGQRQRIGIARALYRRADVLVFDEATSELDPATEREITQSIDRIAAERPGLTLLIIAHRENSLEGCDRIITIGE